MLYDAMCGGQEKAAKSREKRVGVKVIVGHLGMSQAQFSMNGGDSV